jgi:hypothetical protein
MHSGSLDIGSNNLKGCESLGCRDILSLPVSLPEYKSTFA